MAEMVAPVPLDFNALADRAADPGNVAASGTIKKEILHYDILWAMHSAGLLAHLVFKGGTSLRLCHGSPRLSEDLDFAGGAGFSPSIFDGFEEVLGAAIHRHYGLRTFVRPPGPQQQDTPVPVWRLWIAVETHPGRPDIPRQRVKIEVDRSTSDSAEISEPNLNYAHLGAEHQALTLRTARLESVMADKLVALPLSVAGRDNPRHRDIWDLRWLATARGCRPHHHLLAAKAAEVGVEPYRAALAKTLATLPEIVASDAYAAAMRRHLRFDDWERSVASADGRAATVSKIEDLLRECEAALAVGGLERSPEAQERVKGVHPRRAVDNRPAKG